MRTLCFAALFITLTSVVITHAVDLWPTPVLLVSLIIGLASLSYLYPKHARFK